MTMFQNLFNNDLDSEYISGLTDELKGIYIYNKYVNSTESILVVLSTIYEANKMYQILSNYIDDTLLFPMDDFLTSEALASSPELKATRLETLKQISNSKKSIVITNLMGYLRYLPKKSEYEDNTINLSVNTDTNLKELEKKLFNIGYQKEITVSKTGEYALRGCILDIFPIDENNPIRIEFFGDTIDEIRTFSVENQLTIKKIDEIVINPYNENFFGDKAHIGNYLDNYTLIYINYNNIENSYKNLLQEMFNYKLSKGISNDVEYMHDFYKLKKNALYIDDFDNKSLSVSNTKSYISHNILNFSKESNEINLRLNKYLANHKTVVICLNNQNLVNKLLEFLNNDNIVFTNENNIFDDKINVIIKSIYCGFEFERIVVVTDKELYGTKNDIKRYKSHFKYGVRIKSVDNLQVGDYVVHMTHGIGRYIGLKTLPKNNLKKDYIAIEYKGGDKLYIPVEKIENLSRFSSKDGYSPKLNKLGSVEWEKTKLKVRKRLENIAGELLKLYAEREASDGYKFLPDDEEQINFEKEFVYDETIDQIRVIDEIKKDMQNKRPMDRLLCGDVGYGKTEVAFRAMFKAVLSGKQVAYLCPTTILSNQQYENAINRFKHYAINIEVLNRFITSKKLKDIKEGIKDGKIDIVIGTHRLLSDDIDFKNLGLLVVDEEQRFGVKHKEKIKKYKNNIDILTLSATPIPRTLQMSMTGVRSLSLIETPPVDRYPVQTYVLEENEIIIRDAVYKELSRDGQIFILYNNIGDMASKKERLQKIIPDAKIACANGKMTKRELEDVMISFSNKEYDVLLCTTIIETGIDIPNVNTLIIIDADRFGLSQLYQIRGRVGRSNKIAYCYLMYNKGKILTEIATKRLNVIKEFTELGSGFKIAMRDLSIRGAGDILGSEQSGYIDSVGIDLYLKMLNEEINKLKGINIIPENTSEKPLLEVDTSIDDSYVDSEFLKIEIHEKINSIDSYNKLIEIKNEIEDRFGKINENILIYMYEEWFEKEANNLNITNIKQTKNSIEIIFPKDVTNILKGDLLFTEVSRISRMFRFGMKKEQLIITLDTIKLDKHFIFYLIELIEVVKKAIT